MKSISVFRHQHLKSRNGAQMSTKDETTTYDEHKPIRIRERRPTIIKSPTALNNRGNVHWRSDFLYLRTLSKSKSRFVTFWPKVAHCAKLSLPPHYPTPTLHPHYTHTTTTLPHPQYQNRTNTAISLPRTSPQANHPNVAPPPPPGWPPTCSTDVTSEPPVVERREKRQPPPVPVFSPFSPAKRLSPQKPAPNGGVGTGNRRRSRTSRAAATCRTVSSTSPTATTFHSSNHEWMYVQPATAAAPPHAPAAY